MAVLVNCEKAQVNPLKLPGAKDAGIRVLIGQEHAPNFVMLMLELKPGGNTPEHHHPWEEEIFILSGRGTLKTGGEQRTLAPGDAILLLPDESHQFISSDEEPLRFLCVIPRRD